MGQQTTIAAISSPPGAARRALIRLSGPQARSIVAACCRRDGVRLALQERGGVSARFFDGTGEQPVLVLWMPGPASFTGDDVAELHLCGAPDLVRAALEHLHLLGAVPAQPGEFTRRAFENGRIDLARAEGVLALVHARNEEQRRSATALLLGGLSSRVESLRERLVDLRALCEASLDFDENDTGGVPRAELEQHTQNLLFSLDEALAWETARELPIGLPRVVLIGAPNAGKSSLFNRLTDAAALVSNLPGTTRDALHRVWVLPSGSVELWDSAGTDTRRPGADGQEPGSEPDLLARERSRELRAGADMWLWLVDASQGPRSWQHEFEELEAGGGAPPTLLVLHKIDLLTLDEAGELQASVPAELAARLLGILAVSARTEAGLDELLMVTQQALGSGLAMGGIRELSVRHRQALAESRAGVDEARALVSGGQGIDLAAHALRRATEELDQIQGRTTPEDVLSRIFARFCLGK